MKKCKYKLLLCTFVCFQKEQCCPAHCPLNGFNQGLLVFLVKPHCLVHADMKMCFSLVPSKPQTGRIESVQFPEIPMHRE
uniref:Uncharacterized protein n=1 Tax=Anguilla anguilla TaxID=7936 RepID=A0A0E9WZL0_ANGAN